MLPQMNYKIRSFLVVVTMLLSFPCIAQYSGKSDSLIDLIRNSSADTSKVQLLVKEALELQRTNFYDSSFAYADSARIISERIVYKKGMANAYMFLGTYYSAHAESAKALDYNLKALNLNEELGNKMGMVKVYRTLGTVYYGIHGFDNALKYYMEGLKLAEEINAKTELAGLMSNIGIIYHSKQDYGKAMEYYLKAVKVAEENKDNKSRSYVYNSMGKLFFDIGKKDEHPRDFDKAISYYKQSFDLKKEMGDKKGMANTLGNIGDVYIERGQTDDAIKCYREGQALAEESNYREWLETGYNNMSDLYIQKGDFRNALDYYKKYILVKNTIDSLSNTKEMESLQDKFDDERREKEITLLQKDNELKESKLGRQKLTIWFASGGLLIVIIFALFIFRSFKEKQKINLVIEEKNKSITDSIMYARRIQTAILPSEDQLSRSFPDHFILYRPKDIVSGDFYFFAEINNRIIIAVADCTGHGVPGAFMSMIGNSLLNQIIKEKRIVTPAEILNQLHLGVGNALNQNKGSDATTRDGMDIALCSIDKVNGTLEYAGANRSLYFINSNGMNEVAADKSAIGGLQSEEIKKFTNHSLDYVHGDIIYLSTDGYADQFGGPEGKKFRTKRFREMLFNISGKNIPEQHVEMESTISSWMGDNEQLDDILVIGVKL